MLSQMFGVRGHWTAFGGSLATKLLVACCLIGLVQTTVGTRRSEAVGAAGQQVPNRIDVNYDDFGGAQVKVAIFNEVVHDPDRSMLFAGPQTYPAVASDSRLYWIDMPTNQVHVTTPSMEHVFSFGREGQGPGEFTGAWLAAFSPSGRLFVFDRSTLLISEFQPDGTFVRAFRVPTGAARLENMIMLSDTEVVLNVVSIQPIFHGSAAHVFELEAPPGGVGLAQHRSSFALVPDYDLGVYSQVAGGRVTRDLDGGFLYTEHNRYSLSKFDATGRLIWNIETPEAFSPALETYRFSDRGNVLVPHHANSISLLPLGNDFYLHTFRRPPEGLEGTRDRFPEGEHWRVFLELIQVKGGETTRATTEIADSLHLVERTRNGDFYGFLWGDANYNVRSRIEVDQ